MAEEFTKIKDEAREISNFVSKIRRGNVKENLNFIVTRLKTGSKCLETGKDLSGNDCSQLVVGMYLLKTWRMASEFNPPGFEDPDSPQSIQYRRLLGMILDSAQIVLMSAFDDYFELEQYSGEICGYLANLAHKYVEIAKLEPFPGYRKELIVLSINLVKLAYQIYNSHDLQGKFVSYMDVAKQACELSKMVKQAYEVADPNLGGRASRNEVREVSKDFDEALSPYLKLASILEMEQMILPVEPIRIREEQPVAAKEVEKPPMAEEEVGFGSEKEAWKPPAMDDWWKTSSFGDGWENKDIDKDWSSGLGERAYDFAKIGEDLELPSVEDEWKTVDFERSQPYDHIRDDLGYATAKESGGQEKATEITKQIKTEDEPGERKGEVKLEPETAEEIDIPEIIIDESLPLGVSESQSPPLEPRGLKIIDESLPSKARKPQPQQAEKTQKPVIAGKVYKSRQFENFVRPVPASGDGKDIYSGKDKMPATIDSVKHSESSEKCIESTKIDRVEKNEITNSGKLLQIEGEKILASGDAKQEAMDKIESVIKQMLEYKKMAGKNIATGEAMPGPQFVAPAEMMTPGVMNSGLIDEYTKLAEAMSDPDAVILDAEASEFYEAMRMVFSLRPIKKKEPDRIAPAPRVVASRKKARRVFITVTAILFLLVAGYLTWDNRDIILHISKGRSLPKAQNVKVNLPGNVKMGTTTGNMLIIAGNIKFKGDIKPIMTKNNKLYFPGLQVVCYFPDTNNRTVFQDKNFQISPSGDYRLPIFVFGLTKDKPGKVKLTISCSGYGQYETDFLTPKGNPPVVYVPDIVMKQIR